MEIDCHKQPKQVTRQGSARRVDAMTLPTSPPKPRDPWHERPARDERSSGVPRGPGWHLDGASPPVGTLPVRTGCRLWLAEYPCISAFSGLWTYTTGWEYDPVDTICTAGTTPEGVDGERAFVGAACSEPLRTSADQELSSAELGRAFVEGPQRLLAGLCGEGNVYAISEVG